MLVVTNFLVLESFVLATVHWVRSGCSRKPPTRLMLFSVLQLLSLVEWKNVIPLKVRALKIGCLVCFRLQATFFCKRCRASMAKHGRQQSTKVKVKGTDLTWSQICSSICNSAGQ